MVKLSVLGSGTAMKTVPNVVSQTQERAIEILEGEGFVVGTPELVYSDNYEEGMTQEFCDSIGADCYTEDAASAAARAAQILSGQG